MIITAYLIISLIVILLGAAWTGAMGAKGQRIYTFCGFLTILFFMLTFVQQVNLIMAG